MDFNFKKFFCDTCENRENQGKHRKTGENVEKHGKTGRIRGKHRKTRKTGRIKENIEKHGKTGDRKRRQTR